ncbi:serine/threonine protein kinase [Pseudooceanicola batsensis HTCC2597]|uniref:Serine/threonine protein kinase n=1 Tax=Pseudooceanicola batsensis (strain ATCC BAA-863 / DSM 15984 / KCTC 12145 / HTCC2597) TaxID=252305 RepID=A3TWI6_PSEBH|nr:phosphotransferase [Pseudooceanicola batsensis]EAQ03982.1 serine/threonine protein kinase [Pseudooceanicola batsensis HTCC2597]
MTQSDFVPVTVLKRDAFSETISGHLADRPDRRVAFRKLEGLPWWSRPIARFLARREARALKAVQGIAGCPVLISADRRGIMRDWSEGTPLQLAQPAEAAFYRDARRLLREMRRRGVTHNDVAKPQNWLMTPEGRAAVIDFQLASVHRRRGVLFRTMAREDLRHLLKQKRAYAPGLLTASQHRMLTRKSLPTRIWMATAKPIYNFVTRRLFDWSDGEGTEDRLEREGPRIAAALDARADVTGHYTCAFPLPGRGSGLYTFAETGTGPEALRPDLPAGVPEHLQCVPRLPRDAGGTIDAALLSLIAANRLDEVEARLQAEPELRPVADVVLAGRLNLTDRILR